MRSGGVALSALFAVLVIADPGFIQIAKNIQGFDAMAMGLYERMKGSYGFRLFRIQVQV